jgi:hypothetical protein
VRMETLRVSRLHARYRVAGREPAARERLDRVLREMLDEVLEVAVDRAGVPRGEEVCIRQVRVPIRLRLGHSDSALGTAWSVALADSIHETIARGGPDVVRYRSLAHALADLVESVATNDLRRGWAWRQLGLWSVPESSSAAESTSAATRALGAAPESVVAVLAGAARAGLLPKLLRQIQPAEWTALARSALAAAYPAPSPRRYLVDPADRPGSEPLERVPGPAPRTSLVDRVWTTSALASAAVSMNIMPEQRRALAVLAVLEVEPTALREESGPRLVREIERRLLSTSSTGTGSEPRNPAAPAERRSVAAPTHRSDTAPAPTRSRDARDPAVPGDALVGYVGTEASRNRSAPADAAEPVDRDADDPPASGTIRAETRWAGLLFLLHVAEELELPEEILRSAALAGHPFRWVMHRLALALVPLDPRDPAALAFAGLAPGEAVPDPATSGPSPRHLRGAPGPSGLLAPAWGEAGTAGQAPAPGDVQELLPAPTRGEGGAGGLGPGEGGPAKLELRHGETRLSDLDADISRLARLVADRTHERLRGRPPSDRRAADALLRELCLRSGTIVADPGWVDVRLSLREVSTEVRRAGLDLDPGWISWLGVVVRFVYE